MGPPQQTGCLGPMIRAKLAVDVDPILTFGMDPNLAFGTDRHGCAIR
jgi:hypothetical protein